VGDAVSSELEIRLDGRDHEFGEELSGTIDVPTDSGRGRLEVYLAFWEVSGYGFYADHALKETKIHFDASRPGSYPFAITIPATQTPTVAGVDGAALGWLVQARLRARGRDLHGSESVHVWVPGQRPA
jgi:hypothetical protein